MNKLTWIAGTLGIAALATGVGGAAWAAKGSHGGGGSDAGTATIYYTKEGVKQLWTMGLDGSNQVKLGKYAYGDVSNLKYGGRYWFGDIRGQPATPTILSDDFDFDTNNNSATRIALSATGLRYYWQDGQWAVRWSYDDRLYFIAALWDGTTADKGGIYSAAFDVDSSGNITAFDAGSVTLEFEVPFVTPASGDPYPDIRTFDWSVNGDLVYVNAAGLSVLDAGSSTPRQIVAGRTDKPRFSPDGSQIVFTDPSISVSVIGVDGTGLRRIISCNSQWFFHSAHWAPDTKHIAYTGTDVSNTVHETDLFVANTNGSRQTRLTATYSGVFPGICEVAMAVR